MAKFTGLTKLTSGGGGEAILELEARDTNTGTGGPKLSIVIIAHVPQGGKIEPRFLVDLAEEEERADE